MVKFVDDASVVLNVFVPAPLKARWLNAFVPVAGPEIVCAEVPLKVVVPPWTKRPLFVYAPDTERFTGAEAVAYWDTMRFVVDAPFIPIIDAIPLCTVTLLNAEVPVAIPVMMPEVATVYW